MAFFDRMLDVMKLGEDEDDYYDDDEMTTIMMITMMTMIILSSICSARKTMTRMRKKMSSLV